MGAAIAARLYLAGLLSLPGIKIQHPFNTVFVS